MTPARILRAQADELLQQRRRLSTRDLAREDEIVKAAGEFFASHGRNAISFRAVAIALRIGPATLRRHFVDLDCLFQEVLIRHLRSIMEAFQRLPPERAQDHAARREAYREATRGAFGLPSPVHLLLIQQRYTLPEDLLAPIEATLDSMALLLARAPASLTFAILDNPALSPDHAAAILDLPPPPAPEQAAPTPALAAATPATSPPAPLPPTPRRQPPAKIPKDLPRQSQPLTPNRVPWNRRRKQKSFGSLLQKRTRIFFF